MNLHGPVFMIVFNDRDVPPEVFGGGPAPANSNGLAISTRHPLSMEM